MKTFNINIDRLLNNIMIDSTKGSRYVMLYNYYTIKKSMKNLLSLFKEVN